MKAKYSLIGFLVMFTLGTAFAQTALEQRTVELINIKRANHGLPPLIWHDDIADVARRHSMDLMVNDRTYRFERFYFQSKDTSCCCKYKPSG